MKTKLSKFVAVLALGTTLMAGTANAGIIIGVLPITGIIGGVVGLSLAATGFFGAMKSKDLKPWTAVVFVLAENPQVGDVGSALIQRYPEMDMSLVNELSQLILQKGSSVPMGENGWKEVVFSENEIASVLGVLAETNPELESKVRADFTQSSLK